MDRFSIFILKPVSDDSVHQIYIHDNPENVNVWYSRAWMGLLLYARRENFQLAIGRAVHFCKILTIKVDDHFREVTKMIGSGNYLRREMADYYSLIPLTPKNEIDE